MASYASEGGRSAQQVYRRIQWAIIVFSILLVLNAVAVVTIYALEMRLSAHRFVLPETLETNGQPRHGGASASAPRALLVRRDPGAGMIETHPKGGPS